MKETIRKILSVLATVDTGEISALPLDPGLYPQSSLQATIEAFRPYCTVPQHSPAREISVQVNAEHRTESRQVLGAFLNFLLCDALSRRSASA
jgi:hypothetical protein